MDNFFSVAAQVSTLFVYVFLGYLGRKKKIITAEGDKVLSDVIFIFTMPALTITSMTIEVSDQQLANAWTILLISFGLVLFFYACSIVFGTLLHLPQQKRPSFSLATTFANVGYLGFPVAYILLGPLGVFYAAMFNLSHNLLMFTLGVWLAQGKQQRRLDWRQIFNINSQAIIFGFVLALLHIRIPELIFRPLEGLGQATIPMALFLIGSMLAESPLKSIFINKIVYFVAGLRLLIFPLLTLGLLSLLPGLERAVRLVIIMQMAMPTAAVPAAMARKYNSEYKLLSDSVAVSTLLSMLTIPLWVVFANY
ncbi:MAG: AEC family transporter [Clostridia bacterium]|nr:AEC family transporter [Clostridia bacterium]